MHRPAEGPLPEHVLAEGVLVDHEIDETGVSERPIATVRHFHDPASAGTTTQWLAAPDDGSPEHLAELLADPED